MTVEPLISVIIPTYNRAQYILRAIKSVLAQTYQHFEIVVVDDASTDDTEAVVRSITGVPIKYVRHDVNEGAASARNTGIDAAYGDFVAFLDSDDVWLPRKLERQLAYMAASGEDATETLYYTQSINDDGYKKLVLPVRGKRPDEPIASYVFQGNCDINTPTMLLWRELARKIRFAPGLQRHEDVDFCIRLERYGATFAFQPEPLSVYFRGDRCDRISRAIDLGPSLGWLAKHEESFSPGIALAFRARIIAPLLAAQGHTIESLKLVISASLQNAVAPFDALKLLATVVLPGWLQSRLKTAWGRAAASRYQPEHASRDT